MLEAIDGIEAPGARADGGLGLVLQGNDRRVGLTLLALGDLTFGCSIRVSTSGSVTRMRWALMLEMMDGTEALGIWADGDLGRAFHGSDRRVEMRRGGGEILALLTPSVAERLLSAGYGPPGPFSAVSVTDGALV